MTSTMKRYEIRSIKAQNGYTWQISNLIDSCLELIYGILRFLAIAFVVAQITWWLIPIIALFLIPTLLVENRLAKVQVVCLGYKRR